MVSIFFKLFERLVGIVEIEIVLQLALETPSLQKRQVVSTDGVLEFSHLENRQPSFGPINVALALLDLLAEPDGSAVVHLDVIIFLLGSLFFLTLATDGGK